MVNQTLDFKQNRDTVFWTREGGALDCAMCNKECYQAIQSGRLLPGGDNVVGDNGQNSGDKAKLATRQLECRM